MNRGEFASSRGGNSARVAGQAVSLGGGTPVSREGAVESGENPVPAGRDSSATGRGSSATEHGSSASERDSSASEHDSAVAGSGREPHHDDSLSGGLYLDEAGEHQPDYGEPMSYDEHRWGGAHRDVTSGGMPTMSICRVLALKQLAERDHTTGDIIGAIARARSLTDAVTAQRTRSGENRLVVRVRWALATLRQMGYIKIVRTGSPRAARVPNRAESLETYAITAKGEAMLAKDPVRIDESGTGSIRHESSRGSLKVTGEQS